jgi:hypothetical protein
VPAKIIAAASAAIGDDSHAADIRGHRERALLACSGNVQVTVAPD